MTVAPLHVLILEDNPDDAELLAHELQRAGVSISWTQANDRASYLAALRLTPDLILADYSLPSFTALEALEILQAHDLDLPFIVVTGSVSEEAGVACMKRGAADYLLKDRLARLGPAVAQALEQRLMREYQQEAERRVRVSAALNQAVLDSLASNIAVLDDAGRIIAVNGAWERFSAENGGDPAHTGVGVSYLEICRQAAAAGDAEAAQVLVGLQAVLSGAQPGFSLEYSMRSPRATLWFALSATPLASELGGVVVSHTNITARKSAELALRDSEAQLQLIYQGAPIGIALADENGRILSSNPGFQAILGYSAAELRHRQYWQLLPEDQAAEGEPFARLVSGHQPGSSHERRYRHRDGHLVWCRATISRSQGNDGAHHHAVITLEDVSQRKQAEEARLRLAAIVDSTEDAIVGKLLDGTIVAWNRSAERVYGYSADEAIGQPIAMLIPPHEHALARRNLEHVRCGGRITQHECVRVRKDGQLVEMAITISPIIDDRGQIVGISSIGHEIGARKAAERDLRRQTTFVSLLQRVAMAANQAASLDEALQVAVEQICLLIGWPVGHVYLAAEGEQSTLTSTQIWHLADDQRYALFRTITEALEHASLDDLPGRVLSSGGPVWVSDLSEQPALPRARLVSNIGVRAGFAFPVLFGAEVVAVLEFFAAEVIEPDQAMLEVMSHVGTQLGRVFEREHTEAALRASEERYRLIAETTNDVITLTDESGHLVYVSPSCRSLLGYEPAQLLGVAVRDLMHPEDQPQIAALLSWSALNNENLTLRIRGVGGAWRWFDVHSSPLVQDGVAYILSVSRDVTERLEAEAELKRSEQRYRSLFETMSQGVIYQDAEGQILSANPAAERILGLSLEQLQGRTAIDPRWRVIRENGSPLPSEEHPAMRALRSGQAVSHVVMGVYNPTAEAYRWITVNAVPQLYPGEQRPYRVYTTFDDITERREAELALREERALLAGRVAERTADLSAANAQLARAARLKDEFLASMSHELRTPLNAVLGLSEALRECTFGPITAEQDRMLGLIEESGRHLLELINDILDLAKIGAGKVDLDIQVVEIEAICRSSLRIISQAALKKQLSVELDLGRGPRALRADSRRLKQILVNLLSNAVKFTPEGGQIGLEVVSDPDEQLARFTVWDTGIGIPAEQFQRLFQPFVQLDSRLARQYQGTGLGLALVYRLAEMHGGSVSLASEPGVGSRFSIALPWNGDEDLAGDPPAPAQEQLPLAAPGPDDPAPTILLAEDNEANIVMLSSYLSNLGYQLLVARNGAEAVATAREARPAAVLMDIQMPVMDGLEACRRIRAIADLPQPKIIALTALAMPGDREHCLAAGADAYLSKPVGLQGLVRVLGALLQPGAEARNG